MCLLSNLVLSYWAPSALFHLTERNISFHLLCVKYKESFHLILPSETKFTITSRAYRELRWQQIKYSRCNRFWTNWRSWFLVLGKDKGGPWTLRKTNTKITVCLIHQHNNSLLWFKISSKTYPLPRRAGTIGLFLFSSTRWHLVHLVLNSVPVIKRIMPDSFKYQLIK